MCIHQGASKRALNLTPSLASRANDRHFATFSAAYASACCPRCNGQLEPAGSLLCKFPASIANSRPRLPLPIHETAATFIPSSPLMNHCPIKSRFFFSLKQIPALVTHINSPVHAAHTRDPGSASVPPTASIVQPTSHAGFLFFTFPFSPRVSSFPALFPVTIPYQIGRAHV